MGIKGKKIGIDARFMLRPLRGIPLYVTRLCQHLPPLNRDCCFYYFINKKFEHNDSPENYLPRIQALLDSHTNVRIVNCDDEAEIKWEQIYLPKLVKEYNIGLLHMPANRNCFFPRIPTVVTVHDVMEYSYLLDQKFPISWDSYKSIRILQYNIRHRLYVSMNYRCGIKRASKIITVSASSANEISKTFSIESNAISVIHHGVDEDYLSVQPKPFEYRSFTLLLGGDSYQKNPEAAIAAWSKINPTIREMFPLKIIGFCGNHSSPLIQALKKYGLIDSVEIQGWVSQQEMVRYFQDAALFLFPSRFEGFGFPLLQAMATGTPVISTNSTSIPEVLGPVGLKYDPDDPCGMAQGIEKVLSDRNEWHQQSVAGYQHSRQFVWENSAKKHLAVYEELL